MSRKVSNLTFELFSIATNLQSFFCINWYRCLIPLLGYGYRLYCWTASKTGFHKSHSCRNWSYYNGPDMILPSLAHWQNLSSMLIWKYWSNQYFYQFYNKTRRLSANRNPEEKVPIQWNTSKKSCLNILTLFFKNYFSVSQ